MMALLSAYCTEIFVRLKEHLLKFVPFKLSLPSHSAGPGHRSQEQGPESAAASGAGAELRVFWRGGSGEDAQNFTLTFLSSI
jgi:hypothetical protein